MIDDLNTLFLAIHIDATTASVSVKIERWKYDSKIVLKFLNSFAFVFKSLPQTNEKPLGDMHA